MKTLGEILTTTRLQKGMTQTDIARITKIEIKHIKALEKNDYHSLPPATFTKGFIRNYAKALDKNPDDLVAIYRRDSKETKTTPNPTTHSFSLKKTLITTPKSSLALIFLGLFTFFSYLLFQYRALIIPPPLEILKPEPDSVVTSPVIIEGKTSPDSLITVNDVTVKPDQSGNFLTEFNFSPGNHELTITATNRYNRQVTQALTISVISQ